MIPIKAEDWTRDIGKPDDWDEEKHGVCITIPVSDVDIDGRSYMFTTWMPTGDERERLLNGDGLIRLGIMGPPSPYRGQHPVIKIWVD